MSRKLNYYGSYSGFIGLFDLYGTALNGLSVRKLSSSYNGNCLEILRASDNATTNIGFVNNELDTASILSFLNGSKGIVSKWYNQGSGADYIQNSAPLMPEIANNGIINTLNGKPALKFDGSNDYLFSTNPSYVNEFSMFSVCSVNSLAQAPIVGTYQGASFGSVIGNVNSSFRVQNTINQATIFGSSMTGNVQTIQEVIRDFLSDISWTENNVFKNKLNRTGILDLNALGGRIGQAARIYLNGNIQELILDDTDKSSNEVGIRNNINDFYNTY